MAKAKETVQAQSDAELNAVIDRHKKKAARGKIVLIVGIVVTILCAIFMGVIGALIGVVIICIGFAIITKAEKAVKECMTESALVPALEAVFDNVEYFPEEHIDREAILDADMGFDFSIDKVRGNDYVKAEYKGVGIEMSDIQLITEEEYCDDDGDWHTTETTNFQGLWLICDFHKQFSADLLLRERGGLLGGLAKSSIQTESESFNKQFVIRSDSDHDVFYILTPHMMEYIQEMDKKAGGRTYMRFEKEGKLVLALDTGRDSFEINEIKKASAESLRTQFIEEIRYVTDLIDELRLVDTLHEKA